VESGAHDARRSHRVAALAHAAAAARLLAAAFLAAAPGCREPGPAVVLHGEHGPVRVRVELALTSAEQARGLMWRDHLDADAGMLFVFGRPRERVFWMKNTPIPLDIIYIGADSLVVSVAEHTTPYSQAQIPSHGLAKYALEVNAGFARARGIAAGTTVELPPPGAHAEPAH
jgi:uncharacterized protein